MAAVPCGEEGSPVHDQLLLLIPKSKTAAASNATSSQSRLSILGGGIVEIQRSVAGAGGWGRHRTVAAAVSEEAAAFAAFMETAGLGCFAEGKRKLGQSLLQQREMALRDDRQVQATHSSSASNAESLNNHTVKLESLNVVNNVQQSGQGRLTCFLPMTAGGRIGSDEPLDDSA